MYVIECRLLVTFYNCMDRDIPAFNQLIMNKINQKNLQLH